MDEDFDKEVSLAWGELFDAFIKLGQLDVLPKTIIDVLSGYSGLHRIDENPDQLKLFVLNSNE